MKDKKSIFKSVFVIILSLLISMFFVLTISYLIFQFFEFKERKSIEEKKFLESKKFLVKNEVERAKTLIMDEVKNYSELLNLNLQNKVKEACSLLDYRFSNYELSGSSEFNIEETLIKSLKRIDTDEIDLSLIEKKGRVLYTSDRRLLGKNLYNSNLLNTEDRLVIAYRKILKIAGGLDEGFYENDDIYTNENNTPIKSRIYFKNYEPLNLIIIAQIGDQAKKQFRDRVLKSVSRIRFNSEGYIFINKEDGSALVSNGKLLPRGKKLWDIFGEDAKRVFDLEVKAARKNGDFIYYKWTKLSDNKTHYPKLSYVTYIPELKWIIGAGIYLDDVGKEIARLQKELTNKSLTYLLASIFLTIIVFWVIVFIIRKFFRNLKNDFEVFVSFFENAAYSNKKIEQKNVKFKELAILADYANKMVDDKKNIENSLFKEREQLKIIQESMKDALIMVDNEDKIVMLNGSAERIIGYKRGEVLGKKSKEVLNIVDKKKNKRITLFDMANKKNSGSYEYPRDLELISGDGTRYIIEDEVSILKDSTGRRVGLLFVFRDITKRIKNQEEINKVNKLESLGVLAGGIAHDFNNLLTGVFGYISLAKMFLTDEHKSYFFLEEAEKSIDRATSLTRQLLTFSKGGAPVKEEFNLKEHIVRIAESHLIGSDIILNTEIEENLWNIEADRNQILQVISNIVINAKQAIAGTGKIIITAKNFDNSNSNNSRLKKGYYVMISISDNGRGIDSSIIDKIFDPYYTTKKSGSGLGLTICYSIIKKHGGAIEVESLKGKGSTFYIYLPAVTNNENIADENNKNRRTEISGELKFKNIPDGLRVLIMDDEESVRQIGKMILEEMGFIVDVANEGEEAIQKYEDSIKKNMKYSVVIMDLTVVNGMGGKEAVEHMLKIDPEARVIVSSGYSTDPVLSDFSKYGFTGAIKKPFKINDLKKVLIEAINEY